MLYFGGTEAQIGRKGSNRITYHIYPPQGRISGSCDATSLVSKYRGYITANTLGLACFSCVRMRSGGRTIHVTVVDTGGENFDLNEPAFRELCGAAGIQAGRCNIDWEVGAANNCIGNPKAGQQQPPQRQPQQPQRQPQQPQRQPQQQPPQQPRRPPQPRTTSRSRCGTSWTNANMKCGTGCVNDGACRGGERCFASLSVTPCSRARASDDFPDNSVDNLDAIDNNNNDINIGDAVDDNALLSTDVPSSLSSASSSSSEFPAWAIGMTVFGSFVLLFLFVVVLQVGFVLRSL